MVRLEIDRDSYGAARDPETGEDVDLDEDVDREVAERLVAEYDSISIADEDEGEVEGEVEGERDDVDELLDGTVEEVRDALETGDYDDRLDAVGDRADRVGVQDAVEERRDEVRSRRGWV